MLAQHHEFLRQFEQAPQTARQTHVARRAGQLTKATQAHIATLEKSIFAVPGHVSVFDLFQDFDKVRHAVVDPMHALLEGILPFYLRKVMVLGRYCAVPPSLRVSVLRIRRGREAMQRYAARVLPRSKTDGKPIFTQAHLCRPEKMMKWSTLHT
nr:hypothetical protein I308_04363 [Cryptococcus tetragattii IND107]